jgi:hypothetical protein
MRQNLGREYNPDFNLGRRERDSIETTSTQNS